MPVAPMLMAAGYTTGQAAAGEVAYQTAGAAAMHYIGKKAWDYSTTYHDRRNINSNSY